MATSTPSDPTPPPFLSMRSALILVMALCIGALMTGLTLWGGASAPASLIAGLTSAGIALLPLDRLIGR